MCCRQSGLINSAPTLPCVTERCAQGQSGLSSRFTLLKFWTYVVLALNTWLFKVKKFDQTFAWLELGLQLVWFNEMLINHAKYPQAQDAVYMIVNHRRKHKILEACNCFNFFTYFFVCIARRLSKLNRAIFNNLVKRT